MMMTKTTTMKRFDMHFPAGAADDYRAPNKNHLITNADDTGFEDPFEHHHTRSEEDSEDDLEKEEIRKIPGETRDGGGCSDEEGNLREGAVNRTGFADDVVDDDLLDKAEIRNYTEARTKTDKPAAHPGGGECHYNEKTDRAEKDPFGFGEDDHGGDNHYDHDDHVRNNHQGTAQVTHTSHQTLVLVSTYPRRVSRDFYFRCHTCSVVDVVVSRGSSVIEIFCFTIVLFMLSFF